MNLNMQLALFETENDQKPPSSGVQLDAIVIPDKFPVIVIDPPWEYPEGWPAWNGNGERKSIEYPTMTVDAIKAMPIYRLLKHEGYVFLWTTDRFLEESFSVLRAWRCVPRQTVVWCKKPRGLGPGGMFATTTEFVLIGQRIGPNSHARGKRTTGKRFDSSWFEWQRGRHSEKPEEFQDIVEQVTEGPYLEMFARRKRPGWFVWGNEVNSDLCLEI